MVQTKEYSRRGDGKRDRKEIPTTEIREFSHQSNSSMTERGGLGKKPRMVQQQAGVEG